MLGGLKGKSLRLIPLLLILYLVAIAGVEALGIWTWPVLGALGHAGLILLLLTQCITVNREERPALLALVLLPLLRLLSLVMPVPATPQIYWYAYIGIPLLLGVGLVLRSLGLTVAEVGLLPGSWRRQLPIALSGLPLSVVAFLLVRPTPVTIHLQWYDLVFASLVLVVFTAFTEEIIFRGVLQHTAIQVFGGGGIAYCSVLYAVMYLGSLSLPFTCFMGATGLFYGWLVHRSGSIWGVTLAHSIVNVGMLIVLPLLWL